MKIVYLTLIFSQMLSITSFGQNQEEEEEKLAFMNMKKYSFVQIQKKAERYFTKEFKKQGKKTRLEDSLFYKKFEFEGRPIDNAYHKYKRWEWYWKDRLNPDGSFHDITSHLEEYRQLQNQVRPVSLSGGRTTSTTPTWININQTSATGGYNGMGRATFVAFHPTDFNTYYAGAPIGGIWKSTNNQTSYIPLGDSLPYVSTGSIAVNYKNPSVLYISIGDAIGWWNWDLGVYKSTDGGISWKPTKLQWSFTNYQAIRKIVMSPVDTAVLLAATTAGLYRTSNGGNSWTLVHNGFHFDVIFKPNNNNNDGNIVYAGTDNGDIYRSLDAGITWTQIYSSTGSNVRLSVTSADANTLLASYYSTNTILYSRNQGNNFTVTSGSMAENPDMIFVSQTNPNTFYYGGVDIFRSTDAGTTWTQITHWCCPSGGETAVHADQHYAAASPLYPNMIYFCNDGGVYQYDENASKWTEKTNGLVTTQYYNIATAQDNAIVVTGGSQDNGGRYRKPSGTWTASTGGDAMFQAIDPVNSTVMYSTYINGQLFLTTNSWANNTEITPGFSSGSRQVGAWAAPYILDPNSPNAIVAGYNDVWRSPNRGTTWSQISNNLTGGQALGQVAVAPGDSNTIYASQGVNIWKTTNGGTSWTKLTILDATASTDVWGYGSISAIAISTINKNHVWITRTGYNPTVKVYKSTDGGTTWTNISSGLPNVPVNAAIYQKGSVDNIFIGTDAGVFLSTNNSAWSYYGFGMPNTSVTSLAIQYSSQKLRAGTFGRGVWEIDISSVPLPVEFLTVAALPDQSNKTILVTWETTNEINSNYFDIEKSSDGKIFNSIGQIAAAGNTSQAVSYSFTDNNPLSGNNYYRIKEVDLNGNIMYSMIVSGSLASDYYSNVYPSTFNEFVNVIVSSDQPTARIEITDVRGEVMYQSDIETNKKITLGSSLANGFYVATVFYNNKSDVYKIVKE